MRPGRPRSDNLPVLFFFFSDCTAERSPCYSWKRDLSNGLGFIDPTAHKPDGYVELAVRPIDLTGKVIGLLDNTKEQSDIILRTFGEALCEQYGSEGIVLR